MIIINNIAHKSKILIFIFCYFKGPFISSFYEYFTGWKNGTCDDIMTKVLHWLADSIKL